MDITETVERIKRQHPPNDGDYIKNGLLYCGKCHTRKQRKITICGIEQIVPVVCKCRAEEIKREKELQRRRNLEDRIQQLISEGVYDRGYSSCTFENDDGADPKISKVCRRYVDKWNKVFAKNIGLLFYGPKGTGKSFMAYAIANALIDKCVPVCITSFPRLLNATVILDKRQHVIDCLNNYDLLIIDDLGVERGSDYSLEQMFNIVNSRYTARKPLIVTTNLSLKELQNPTDLAYDRIYDRILEMCPVQLKMDENSRRAAIADKKKEEARRILGT